jgi:hypothetical protein
VIVEALLARRLRKMMHLQQKIYIDRSLITCTEYQVFLDEQLVLGNYYQPDHWKNSSFEAGSGKRPMLGVQLAGAQAFCQWLTDRDEEGWQYRLPHAKEWAAEERMRESKLSPEIGYWVEDEPFFEWSQREPSEALQRSLGRALMHDSDLARVHNLGPDYTLGPDLDLILDLNLDLALNPDLNSAFTLDRALSSAFARALRRPFAPVLTLEGMFARDLALELDRARVLVHDLNLDRPRTFDNVHVINNLHAIDRALDRALVLAIALINDRVSSRSIGRTLDMYYILKLFKERIAGNLLACEGILLVKERR